MLSRPRRAFVRVVKPYTDSNRWTIYQVRTTRGGAHNSVLIKEFYGKLEAKNYADALNGKLPKEEADKVIYKNS